MPIISVNKNCYFFRAVRKIWCTIIEYWQLFVEFKIAFCQLFIKQYFQFIIFLAHFLSNRVFPRQKSDSIFIRDAGIVFRTAICFETSCLELEQVHPRYHFALCSKNSMWRIIIKSSLFQQLTNKEYSGFVRKRLYDG